MLHMEREDDDAKLKQIRSFSFPFVNESEHIRQAWWWRKHTLMSITKQSYLLESLKQFLADVKLSGQSGGIIYAISEGTEINGCDREIRLMRLMSVHNWQIHAKRFRGLTQDQNLIRSQEIYTLRSQKSLININNAAATEWSLMTAALFSLIRYVGVISLIPSTHTAL